MDWKREAAQLLREHPLKLEATQTLPGQIKALEAASTAYPTRSNAEPVAGSSVSRGEDRLINNIVKRDLLQSSLRLALADVAAVERALSVLPEADRRILDRFFIHRTGDFIQRLQEELCVERAQVYKLKDRALRSFTLAMFGKTET